MTQLFFLFCFLRIVHGNETLHRKAESMLCRISFIETCFQMKEKKNDPKKKVNKNKDFCRDEMQIHSWMIKMMYRHLKMSFVIIFI